MYYTVDRFESDHAILEQEARGMRTVPRSLLPLDAAEGSVLKEEDGRFVRAEDEESARAARIRAKMDKLWK